MTKSESRQLLEENYNTSVRFFFALHFGCGGKYLGSTNSGSVAAAAAAAAARRRRAFLPPRLVGAEAAATAELWLLWLP